MIVPTAANIRKIVSEMLEKDHPLNGMILSLIEKNRNAAPPHLIDYESLIFEMRYSVSLINRTANKLEEEFKNINRFGL